MLKAVRVSALSLLLSLAACGLIETSGDFTYICKPGIGMSDDASCEHRLTDRYLLRYGEGSGGDDVILAYEARGGGSASFIDDATNDVVAQLALDDRILVARPRSGQIYVAPAHPERWPEIIGPLNEHEFSARFANPPEWRDVQ